MTKLPLHRLLAQLQAAGFDITAHEWYRVELALSQHQQLLHSQEGLTELGLLLGPLLCKNEKQQEIFQRVYQQYLEELPKGGRTIIEDVQTPKNARWWLPALLALMLLLVGTRASIWYTTNYAAARNLDRFDYEFDWGEDHYKVGDTIRLINRTLPKDTVGHEFYWYIKDQNRNVLQRHVGFDNPAWIFDVPVGKDHLLQFVVWSRGRSTQVFASEEQPFEVFCANAPQITGPIQVTGDLRPGETIGFSATVDGASFIYSWRINDRDSLSGPEPTYTFAEADRYTINLTVIDTSGQAGYCRDEAQFFLEIEEEQPERVLVSMPPLTLKKDQEAIEYFFPVWLIVLISLLPVLAAALWTIWYYRRRNFHKKKAEERAAKLAAIQINDKAPYDIPFQNRQSEINKSPLQFNMANVLRRRQEGTREMLDVPQTIRRTVEGGGYLDLQFRYNTRPTDYLFLIDQASAESHLARLFVYLTETLRDQDVHVDYWTYRTDFDRFWNPGYQGFMTLGQLYKNYGERKLIVFGNADELLDVHRSKDTLDTFQRWKYRLLVTPRPLASWSSKEKRLYQYFPIFPANLQSLMEAVRLIEREWEPEDLPANFRDWQAQLERKIPEDPDSEQRWRKWPQYKAYLQQHPELLPWLKALVVHPDLRWDLTIAIGKAINAPVTFDNLLILSRIPDFEQGAFPVKVWRAIWPQLDLEQEWTARRRVKAELEAISAEAVQGSYAEQTLQTDLALQNFALQPYNENYQEAIRLRLETGQIDQLRLEELDQIVERQTDTDLPADAQRGDRTEAFLRKQETQEKPPVRTPLFWWAAALTLLGLLGWTGLIGLDWQAVGEYFRNKNGELPFYMDSHQANHRLLNNQAVEHLYPDGLAPDKADILGDGPRSIDLLQQSLALVPNYVLAQQNLEKLYSLMGQTYYEQLAQDTSLEQSAYDNFLLALEAPEVRPSRDSTDFFAFHGLAGIQHTLLRPDSACVYVDSLRKHYPDLLLDYAGDLLYLDHCANADPDTIETDIQQEQVPEQVVNPFKLYVIPEDDFSRADNQFGLGLIRSLLAVDANTTLPQWVASVNRFGGLVDGDAATQEYAEDEIDFQFISRGDQNSYALLLSAAEYIQHPELIYANENSQEMSDVLRRNGFRVEPVFNFSAEEFRQALRSYQDRLYGPNDQLIIYYSGYVYRDENSDDFIWPINKAAIQQENIPRTEAQRISSEELNQLLDGIPCPRIIVMMDAFRLPDTPSGSSEQNTAPTQLPLDNIAQITLSIGGRERYSQYGFIIDEFEGDLIIAAPHIPLSENDTKLYGPDFRVQLNGRTQTFDAELIEAYDQDSLAYLRLPKPSGFSWNFDDLNQRGELRTGQSVYFLRENNQPAVFPGPLRVGPEGELSLRIDQREQSGPVPYLARNVLFSEGKIAGLITGADIATGSLSGRSFGTILAYWENTLQQMILQQDDAPDYELPPGFPLPEMVSIRGGTFTMGCTEGVREIVGDDCGEDETAHQVRLDDYQIATTEVTFAQYDAFCEATGREKPEDEGWGRENRPVIKVQWYDAVAFCNWLSEVTGRESVYFIEGEEVSFDVKANGYRLPTEAEWEYAARERGREVVFGNGKNIADPAEVNFNGSAAYQTEYSVVGADRRQTVPVASLNSPNALGLHDMSGNVFEWCWEWYGDYSQSIPNNFTGTGFEYMRVARGGYWGSDAKHSRAALRDASNGFNRSSGIGFRLARNSL